MDRRRAGILLHITSLPGGLGNGDLGQDAYRFVDFLANCGISVWQTLPINPTHPDGSPYQCLSAHAGNPLMINLKWLSDRRWLPALPDVPNKTPIAHFRIHCITQAFDAFQKDSKSEYRESYDEFVKRHDWWLSDYALFITLREELGSKAWQEWPVALRDRQPDALQAAQLRLADRIAQVKFEQFVFFEQWTELRQYARQRGVMLFGDMPIFVAGDSADVWACRECFDLTDTGYARVVAGVPPDYFSATGQRWGNPHYNWEHLKATGFRWWLDRFRSQLALYDWLRIDHFRGLEAYWEIPAESETAVHGRWVKAPGDALLETVFATLNGSGLPLVAENLGIITPEVEALRNRFDIPGMLILQFAFDGGDDNPYLPHNHTENNVVYTGTHDNDTTLSWYENLSDSQRDRVCDYLRNHCGYETIRMPESLVRCALASVARLAVIPMQDVLGLGHGHRMNTPGTLSGNWQWRFSWEQLNESKAQNLTAWVRDHGRHVQSVQSARTGF